MRWGMCENAPLTAHFKHHHHINLCSCFLGIYDKPEEANWPQRAHAEGLIWAKDFMHGCWSCGRKVSPDFSERASCVLTFHISVIALLTCRAMNISEIHTLGIHMLPGYSDPYHGRPLTKGELGCFLSHYNIWKEVKLRSRSSRHVEQGVWWNLDESVLS